jgi:hypothetical protein
MHCALELLLKETNESTVYFIEAANWRQRIDRIFRWWL